MAIEVEVNGQVIEFPDGTDEGTMQQVLATQFPQEVPATPEMEQAQQQGQQQPPPVPMPTPESDDLMARFGGTLGEGLDANYERQSALSERSASPMEHTQTAISQGLRTGGAAATDILSYGWDNLPEYLKDPIKTTAKQGLDYMSELPGVKQGIEMAQAGLENYENWAENNPVDAEQVESVFDISAIAFPRVNPIRPFSAKKVGESIQKNNIERIQTTLEPAPNTGPGTWTETDLATGRHAVYTPSVNEKEMYSVVDMVDGYNPARTSRKNAATVLSDVSGSAAELDARIINQGNPKIDLEAVKAELSARMASLPETDITLVGNAETIANRVLEASYQIIDASDGTAKGLMDARRSIDKLVRKTRGAGAYDPDRINGVDSAARVARDLLNESVIEAVPDANVHDLLFRQHKLLQSHDILDGKAQLEARNAFGRIAKNLKSSALIPTGVLSTIALGGYAAGSPTLAMFAAGAGGLYLAGKATPIGVRASKNILRGTLVGLNKAIGKAQKSDVAKLKADRAILLDYMHSLPEEDDEPTQ